MYPRVVAVAVALAGGCKDDPRRGVAHAEPVDHEATEAAPLAPPCDGCTLDIPASDREIPLLVVMHGDRETASIAADRWREVTKARGWALLSLQCPVSEGCKDSWWQWSGDPGWVTRQVETVLGEAPIDRSRVFLIGWSGGGSYIGMYAQHWDSTFAAVVIHGGGQAPIKDDCPTRPLPAYFLVGDQNPAHGAAKQLRAYLEGCGEEVIWDLVEGADHRHEDAALDHNKGDVILDWLERRPR
ncbi:MAG: hypothetical protein JWO36_1238 [Myxococcales bacterium]|nr:hypothetical protein [Myxococcales bacterium]